MDTVARIGVSLEPKLLEEFDKQIAAKGYASRSEALRALVRDSLAENEWKNEDAPVKGVLVTVYDPKVLGVNDRLAEFFSEKRDMIMFNTEFALGDNMMMIIAAHGTLGDLKRMTNEVMTVRGMHRGRLTMASADTHNMHHAGVRE
jgi:CopG family nickel-responsive transcriptional regulator